MASKLVRLIAVLVALVVPLQGMASVAAVQCMALGHHQDAGQKVHDHAHGEADSGEHDTPEDTGGNAYCGPCMSCCASASMADAGGASMVSARSNAEHLLSQPSPGGVEPDGVYRPPLSL